MRIQHLILALFVVAVWGFNFVVIEVGLHEIPPLALCAIRFLLTSIPAIFFFKRPAISWKLLIAYGLIMFALQFNFLFAGIYAGVTPGLASLIMQTQIFFTVILATIFLHEKPNQWQILGMLTAFAGIVLVGIRLEGNVTFAGFIFLVAAGAAWAVGNLMSKKIGQTNMFGLVIWGNFIAFPLTLLSAFLFEGKTAVLLSLHHLSWLTLAAVGFIVYCSTIFGYGSWGWLLRRYPIATVAPYALLVPIIGFFSSAIVLHEPLQSWKLFAGLLVVTGLFINFFGTRWAARKAVSDLEAKIFIADEMPEVK